MNAKGLQHRSYHSKRRITPFTSYHTLEKYFISGLGSFRKPPSTKVVLLPPHSASRERGSSYIGLAADTQPMVQTIVREGIRLAVRGGRGGDGHNALVVQDCACLFHDATSACCCRLAQTCLQPRSA